MRALILPAAVVLLVVAAMVFQAYSPETHVCAAPDVRLDEIDGFVSEDVPVAEAERTILASDTEFVKRLYRAESGDWFKVTVVIGGKSKTSIHRPELCLPSQGYQMSAPSAAEVAGIPWHFVRIARHTESDKVFAYTFFNQDGFRTASHVRRIFRDVWDRSIRGRVDRWMMVTVCSSKDDGRAMTDFLCRLKGALK